MRRARRRDEPARDQPRHPAGRRRCPRLVGPARPVGPRRRRRPARDAAADRVHGRHARRAVSSLPARRRHVRGVRHLARIAARPPRPRRLRLVGARARKPPPPASSPASWNRPPPRGSRSRRAARWSNSVTTRRSCRTRTPSRCSRSTAPDSPSARATARFSSATASSLPPTWSDRARRHPERFSPNVLLRPIVQDALFPTVCYVAGPSELAYQGELGPVYEHFGVPQPLVAPRATATLLDAAAAKFLAKHDMAFESLQPDNESALNHLLEAQLPSVDRRGPRRRVEGGRGRHGPPDRGAPGSRRDARGRRQVVAGPDAARPWSAAREDHPGREAARRDAAPAVRPDPLARVSRRASAGASDRIRLLPEPLRPGAGRSAARGAGRPTRARTGC